MTTKIWNGSGDVGTADGRWQSCTVSFPTLSITSAALIASAIIVGAKSQARMASTKLFDAGGLGKYKYL